MIALNDQGTVLGEAEYEGDCGPSSQSFIWNKGNGFDWITLPDRHVEVFDINNKGNVVGEADEQPFIWNKALGF